MLFVLLSISVMSYWERVGWLTSDESLIGCISFELVWGIDILWTLLFMLLCDENKILGNKSDEILLEKISYSFLENFLEV